MVGAGQLTDLVVIQQNTTTADSQGGRSSSWSTLARVWASVTPSSASEQLIVQAVQSAVGYAVTIRYRADVTPSMRVSWTPHQHTTAKTLQILGVYPLDGHRAFLMLTCGEVI